MSKRSFFQIQRLDGYTDGKPSWIKENVMEAWKLRTKEGASEVLGELRQAHPSRQYRMRKVTRGK